jgi:predicted O-methyltransferase YrrM
VVETFKPFPSVRIIRGLIPETLDAIDAPAISYLSIDLNNAFAEKCVLERLWERLVPGALIVFDDYGFTEHAEQRKAHDAFAAAHDTFVLALPTGQGLLMKA